MTGGDAKPLRVGVVGLGRWGRNIARTIRQETPGLLLAAAASRAEDAQEVAGPEARIYQDWRAMIADARLDGVLLAAPARLHVEIASEAIRAGLPVFVEKPMALTLADAEALAALGARTADPEGMKEATQAFGKAAECIARSGGASAFDQEGSPAGGEVKYFEQILSRLPN